MGIQSSCFKSTRSQGSSPRPPHQNRESTSAPADGQTKPRPATGRTSSDRRPVVEGAADLTVRTDAPVRHEPSGRSGSSVRAGSSAGTTSSVRTQSSGQANLSNRAESFTDAASSGRPQALRPATSSVQAQLSGGPGSTVQRKSQEKTSPPPRARPAAGTGTPLQSQASEASVSSERTSSTPRQIPHIGPGADAGNTLWNRACASLRGKNSKHLRRLEEILDSFENKGSITDQISKLSDERQARIRASDGISQSRFRKQLARIANFMVTLRPMAMGLSRLDPHGIAPIVLGGIFTLVQLLQNDNEETLAALTKTAELAGLVALWSNVETLQIRKNHDRRLTGIFRTLSDQVAGLYEDVIVLLGTMIAYFDKARLGQLLGATMSAHAEWNNLHARLKSHEEMCNQTRSQISNWKERQEAVSKILKFVSSYDTQGAYQHIIDDTGIGGMYKDRCQWLLELDQFKEWSDPGDSSVLWLNGTIGMGKTTLMARAIHEIRRSSGMGGEVRPLAMFFFQKTLGAMTSSASTDVNACLRSLVRQLSWNELTAEVDPVTETLYNERLHQHRQDSPLDTGECLKLLKELISRREIYIMIDAIDECDDPIKLLRLLKELTLHADQNTQKSHFLHIMISGRNDMNVSNFWKCLSITTTSDQSAHDQAFFIKTELKRWGVLREDSLFFSDIRYPTRLQDVLTRKGAGVFRWIQIQIEKFTQLDFMTRAEIEHDLRRLETHTGLPELDKEYARLLGRLRNSGDSRDHAIKMLKLIACSLTPLTVDHLSEAITSTQENRGSKIGSDDIRRLLVGFISEADSKDDSPLNMGWKFKNVHGGMIVSPRPARRPAVLFVQFAHASVLEYLLDDRTCPGDFTIRGQHEEAAYLCFRSISRAGLDKIPERFEDSDADKYPMFLAYSCLMWPIHCSIASLGKPFCPLVEATRKFILSDAYFTWNTLLSGPGYYWEAIHLEPLMRISELRGLPGYPLHQHSVRVTHDSSTRMAGFVIIAFGLDEILRFPDIHSLINPAHVNLSRENLRTFASQYATPETMTLLHKFLPRQGWNDMVSLNPFQMWLVNQDWSRLQK